MSEVMGLGRYGLITDVIPDDKPGPNEKVTSLS